MQDRIMVSSDKIQAIAAAINEKTGNNAGMTLEEMADAIKNIPTVDENKNNCFTMDFVKIKTYTLPFTLA